MDSLTEETFTADLTLVVIIALSPNGDQIILRCEGIGIQLMVQEGGLASLCLSPPPNPFVDGPFRFSLLGSNLQKITMKQKGDIKKDGWMTNFDPTQRPNRMEG